MDQSPPAKLPFSYKIEYIPWKDKIEICISNYGDVIVKAPRGLARWQIHKVVCENAEGIIRTLNANKSAKNEKPIDAGTITLQGVEIPFAVEYSSRRRKGTIEIGESAQVAVKVPSGMSSGQIYDLLRRNESWLIRNLAVVEKAGLSGHEQTSVTYGGLTFPYVIKYSGRAVHYTLKIQDDNSIYVTVPAMAPPDDVHAFVESHAAYIHEKITDPDRIPARRIEFKNGGSILLKGREVKIKVVCKKPGCEPALKKGCLIVPFACRPADDDPCISDAVSAYLRSTTKKEVNRFLPGYCKALGLKMPETDIRLYKTCWGKCIPGRGMVIFNERLAMLPGDLIEYVVAHELCHFYHPNHKREFYNTLRTVMPDADERKKRVKNYRITHIK